MRSRATIALIIAVYTVLAVFYSLATPVFEAPDELWHYLVIRHIVDYDSLPIQVRPPGESLSRQEASQPPLYYLIAAFLLDVANRDDRQPVRVLDDVAELNPFGQPGVLGARENRNIVFHSADEGFPYSGVTLDVHLLRLLSIALGMVTVVATYALALQLADGWLPYPRALALTAAALNATIPQFLYITSSVNNDNLATALSSLGLLAAVGIVKTGFATRHALWLGLLVGMSAITKLSGLALLPLVALAAVLSSSWGNTGIVRHPALSGQGPSVGGGDVARNLPVSGRAKTVVRRCVGRLGLPPGREAIALGAWFLAPAVIVAGWWYARNLLLYGELTGLGAMMAWLGQRTEPYAWSEAGADLAHLWISFWGLFGWSNIPAEEYLYHWYGLLCALAVGGWLVALVRRRPVPRFAVLGLVLILAYILILSLLLVRYHLITVAAEGRLLFPAISGFSVLISFGIALLVPPRCIRALSLVLAVALGAIAASVPLRSIQSAFALPEQTQPSYAVSRAVQVGYGEAVELVRFGLDQPALAPGETARFTFEWRRTAKVDGYFTFFVQVLDKNGRRVGGIDAFPSRGLYPIHRWPVGERVLDVYEISISNDAAAPGIATIIAGMYDSRTGAPVPARDRSGTSIGTTPVVGRLKISSIVAAEPAPDRAVGVTLGDAILLSGYSIGIDTARPGDNISGKIHWRSLSRVPQDYVVFVQLVGPRGLVAQHDSQPDAGGNPTSLWDVGETIIDTFDLRLKDSVPLGDYALIVGMYDPATGKRLATPVGDFVELKRIRVAP